MSVYLEIGVVSSPPRLGVLGATSTARDLCASQGSEAHHFGRAGHTWFEACVLEAITRIYNHGRASVWPQRRLRRSCHVSVTQPVTTRGEPSTLLATRLLLTHVGRSAWLRQKDQQWLIDGEAHDEVAMK